MKPIAENSAISIYIIAGESLPTNVIGRTITYSMLDGRANCKGIQCSNCVFSAQDENGSFLNCSNLKDTIPIIVNLFPELRITHPELLI